MKLAKHFLLLLLFVLTLSLNAQEGDCEQFLPLFEAGEYDKVVTMLLQCKQDNSLSQKTIDEYDFYLQLSYGYLEDFDNFDAERLEGLTENYDFRNNKNIVDAFLLLLQYYANISNSDKANELVDPLLFFAQQYDSDMYAWLLMSFASAYADSGSFKKAIELEEQTLDIQKQTLGENHPDYGTSLNNLALYHSHLGDYLKAIELGKQALDIQKQILGENHPYYATSLSNLALYNYHLGEYSKAIEIGEQALEIRKQTLGKYHPDYATSLSNLAECHSDLGDNSKAIELGEQALEIKKQILGENHRSYATSLNNLASNYSDLGDYSKAIELGEQALEIHKQILGENHPDYAVSLNTLASNLSYLGDYSKAIELLEQALKIQKQTLGENHPDYAASLNILGSNYSDLGDYSKAIELGEQALEIRKQILGENHPAYATSLSNLASDYSNIGGYSKAIELEEQALEIRKQILGENHPAYANSLNNLAVFHSSLGNCFKAIELNEQASGILKQIFGENHPNYGTTLSNLASYNADLGDYQKAIELVEQGMAIKKVVYGENHPDYATSLNNLSRYHSYLGDFSKAVELNTQALEILKQTLGDNHPDYILSLGNLSLHYFCSKDVVQSAIYKGEAFHKKKELLQTQFNWLTENQRLLYWNNQNTLFINLPYFAFESHSSSFIDLSYDGALLSKSLMLNSSIELNNLLMESGDKEVIEKANELRTILYTLNRLYEKPITERFLDTDPLERVAQNLERDLLKLSKEYGDYTQFMSLTWQDVQKGLGEEDVAIEFVEFPILKSDSTMYAALVLRKYWERPQMIPLFEKREIEQYMTQSPDKQYSGFVGKQLYKLMWKPLEEVIQKGDAVHFSAAGVYHQLALEYLPTEDGTPLSENYNFHRLSSTRQLALEEQKTVLKNAMLYGGIQYDVNPSEMLAESNKYQEDKSLYAYRGMSVDSLRGGNWVPLDNTVKEVEFISNELATNKIETVLFTGANANEESIKALSGKKTNILHLATHGFFLPIEETRKVDYYQMIGRDDNPTPDMSMRRSGLIMAGGNRAWIGDTIPEGVDDGILTAQEISALDFREMDLVVLSACETALGDIDTSEGVFGLQRAFKKAGAKTLIMSLWKVNDEVTKSLMNKFYKSLLSGKTKHEAFLEAQQFIRFRHPEPQNWAAFIMLD